MKIDVDAIKKVINDPSIPTTKLERETGVTRAQIANLRAGRSSWEKVWLLTLEKFQRYIDRI